MEKLHYINKNQKGRTAVRPFILFLNSWRLSPLFSLNKSEPNEPKTTPSFGWIQPIVMWSCL